MLGGWRFTTDYFCNCINNLVFLDYFNYFYLSIPVNNVQFFFVFRGTQVRNKGQLILTAEELDSCKDVLHMQFSGHKLDKKDFFGSSDPFMVFSRCNEDNT